MATCNSINVASNNVSANATPTGDGTGTINVGGNGMGLGRIGASDIIHKRKFRFVFSLAYCNNTQFVPAYFVKTAARPSITIEETEINFLNEKTWIPGKAAWETITVTYYDVGTSDNMDLFSWLASVYDFTNPFCRWQNARRMDYAGTATLIMLDGCGTPMEAWIMSDLWPTSIKFGDLDYSSNDVVDIELSLRYSQVQYINACGGTINRCGCNPCTPTSEPSAPDVPVAI